MTAASRTTDPITSYIAAATVDVSSQAAWFLRAVANNPGRTASELAAVGPFDRYQANRRLADLERNGHVTKGKPKRSAVTARTEVTWLPVLRQGALL